MTEQPNLDILELAEPWKHPAVAEALAELKAAKGGAVRAARARVFLAADQARRAQTTPENPNAS